MKFLDLLRRKRNCNHVADLGEVEPSSTDSCLQCVELGDTWVNLRICLICGQVGCCDNSKNKHATAHYKETGHPVIQSYELDETWRYCYAHDRNLVDAGSPARAHSD